MSRFDLYWYLNGHTPVSTADPGKAFPRNPDKRRVALDEVGEARISTVFLGIDHQWGSGPPLLFETMVFGGPMDEQQWRYSTWDEAEAGHHRVVEAVREGRILDD